MFVAVGELVDELLISEHFTPIVSKLTSFLLTGAPTIQQFAANALQPVTKCGFVVSQSLRVENPLASLTKLLVAKQSYLPLRLQLAYAALNADEGLTFLACEAVDLLVGIVEFLGNSFDETVHRDTCYLLVHTVIIIRGIIIC